MKKGLIGALVGSALTAASFFGYHALENRWNSPEYLREKDLDEKAAFLLNGASTCFNDSYLLPNGLKVEVKKDYRHNFLPGTSDRLELKFHRVEMRSEYDGLRTLDQIMFFDAQTGTLVIRERDQIPNYPEWQVKYEELIEQTAIAKKAHLEEEKRKQDEAIKRVEEKLKSGELLRGEKNE